MQEHFSNLQRTFWIPVGKIQSMPEGLPLRPYRDFTRRNTVPIFVGTSLYTPGNRWLPFPREHSLPLPSKPSSKMVGAKGATQEVQGEACSPGKADRLGGPWVLPQSLELPGAVPQCQSWSCPAPRPPTASAAQLSPLPPPSPCWNLPYRLYWWWFIMLCFLEHREQLITILFSEPLCLKNHVPSWWFSSSLRVFFLTEPFPQMFYFSLIHSTHHNFSFALPSLWHFSECSN